MLLLRLAPLAAVLLVAACSGAPTAPSLSAHAVPSFESTASDSFGGHMGGSGNINDDGGGFGSGSLTTTSSNDGTAPTDSTTTTSRGTNMVGSGN